MPEWQLGLEVPYSPEVEPAPPTHPLILPPPYRIDPEELEPVEIGLPPESQGVDEEAAEADPTSDTKLMTQVGD